MRFSILLTATVVFGCATKAASPDGIAPGPTEDSSTDIAAAVPDGRSPAPPGADAQGARDTASLPREAGSEAGSEAPLAFNPPACGQIDSALFCDDFEAGLNPAYRTRTSSGATIVVDATRARGGKNALHVRSQVVAYSTGEVTLGKPVFPTAGNSFFMRAFVYYAPPAAPDNVYLFRLNGAVPGTTTAVNAQFGATGNPYNKPTAANFKHLSTLIYHSAIPTADHFSYANPAAPEVSYGRWSCWELQVDGAKNEWRVWIDGVEHFSRTWNGSPTAPWLVPTPTTLSIGVLHPHDQAGVTEVWYDDLVIGSKRVGCGAP